MSKNELENIQNELLLQTDFEVMDKKILVYILFIFVMAELSVNEKRVPWEEDENIKKRRKAYEFDGNLQNLLKLLGKHELIQTEVIPCGSSGLYKTEIVIREKYYLHCHASFNITAKYIEKYLNMNHDMSEKRYVYFQYSWNNKKQLITSLKLMQPEPHNNRNHVLYDFTSTLKKVRESVSLNYGNPHLFVNEYYKLLDV